MSASTMYTQSTQSYILRLPLPGKPDPMQKYESGKPDLRARVLQCANKYNTCWYYVFNYLRKRIGKHPDVQELPERKIEKLLSERRKRKSEYTKKLLNIIQLLDEPEAVGFFRSCTKEDMEIVSLALKPYLRDPKFRVAFDDFNNQSNFDNLYDYLLWLKTGRFAEIDEKLLHDLGEDPEIRYDSFAQAYPYDVVTEAFKAQKWEQLSTFHKGAWLDSLVMNVAADRYGLKKSTWSPARSIDDLIAEITLHGPLYIQGYFGSEFYPEVAEFLMNDKIEGRDVYGFRLGSQMEKAGVLCHAVLLVGAKKMNKTGGYVYFIDPNNESDPKEPKKQKIYCMSYAKLARDVSDLMGILGPEDDSPSGFAYYGCV